jgi:hypothetical protein
MNPRLKSASSSTGESRRLRRRRAGIFARTDFGNSSHGFDVATFSLIAILKMDESRVTSLFTVVGLRLVFTAFPFDGRKLERPEEEKQLTLNTMPCISQQKRTTLTGCLRTSGI